MNFGDLGARLRNTVVTLVVCLTLVVNLVLSIATLAEPISLYTLLIYGLLVYVLVLLLEHAVVAEDVKEAMSTNVYPARFRAPLKTEFVDYIAVWLIWWFVSQVFFDAGIVFEQGFLLQLILIPLVILSLTLNTIFEVKARYRRYVIGMLLFVSAVTLFFPTFSWAPQHSGALSTVFRVVMYFVSILIQDWLVPANSYVQIPASAPTVRQFDYDSSTDPQDGSEDLESGMQLSERRRMRIMSVVEAFGRVNEEKWRAREFIAMSAWILVTPLVITLMLFLISLAATFERSRRHETLAPKVEVVPVHVEPAAPIYTPPVQQQQQQQQHHYPPTKHYPAPRRERTTSAIAATTAPPPRAPEPEPPRVESPVVPRGGSGKVSIKRIF